MLKRAKFIQVVNKDYKIFINSLGIINRNIFVKHAFLPPPLEEESKIITTYDEELINFIQTKKPLIVANAYALDFHNNEDLYGLDMCIELIKLLKKDFPSVGFLFALANEKINNYYFEKMKNKVKKLNLQENFYFIIGQKELWPLFKKVDLMIRPTCVDAYGISIAEALYFSCPAIASDVCIRPKGTILFKNRNLADLYEKCKQVLNEIF